MVDNQLHQSEWLLKFKSWSFANKIIIPPLLTHHLLLQ